MPTCPHNHQSETADYCSVCGIAMPEKVAERIPVPVSPPINPAGGKCPDCGAALEAPEQKICEICGFNLETGTSEVPALRQAGSNARPQWNAVVSVDGNIFGKVEPQAPIGHAPQVFTLFEVVNYIGRGGAGMRVHVPVVADDAVSRHQAVLTRTPSGNLTVRDLGSANGTFLNGKPLSPGVETAIHDGDVLAMGAWTRIVLRMN